MNLFIIGWRPSGGLEALRPQAHLGDLVAKLPPPRPTLVQRWAAPSGRLVMACAAHHPDRVGGIRYVHRERDRVALFSGRPIRWTGEEQADGRGPLDARFYLPPAGEWMGTLDGRCVAARYDDREGVLELYSDPLGAYPLFWGERSGTRWISNSAQLVRRMLETLEAEPAAVSGVLATGWSLSRGSMWTGVHRFSRGAVVALRGHGRDTETRQLPLEEIADMSGRRFDPTRAARLLVAATAALADWPGRPVLLQLSGGRDSRLLLAAAVAAKIDLEVVSTGGPNDPDARIARQICASAGVKHHLRPADPDERMHARLRDMSRYLGITSGGAISLEDAPGYFDPAENGMQLLLNGQGGEIARAYYGSGEGISRDELVRKLLDRVATSVHLLTPSARQLVEGEIGHAVDGALGSGAAHRDVPDLFYFEQRMAGWAATGHGCVEYAKGDVICPLWSRRLLGEQLGLPIGERISERFPEDVLGALSPALADIPYAAPTSQQPVSPAVARVCQRVAEALWSQPDLPAWKVLDRASVERVLNSDPAALDRRGMRPVWRLATATMALRPA